MKKLLLTVIATLTIAAPSFAIQNVELLSGSEYLYFANARIQSIKSNNPEIISAQRVASIDADTQQILFTAKKEGLAKVQIDTDKGLLSYTIEIKKDAAQANNNFIKLDVPRLGTND